MRFSDIRQAGEAPEGCSPDTPRQERVKRRSAMITDDHCRVRSRCRVLLQPDMP
jgi:hypothetical protein